MIQTIEVTWIHYVPIVTTILSVIFATLLFRRYATRRSSLHLLWWGLGVTAYGLGTAIESSITLLGNSVLQTKAWYIAGALLGAYPLAQWTVYLLLERRKADLLTKISLPFIAFAALLVVLSPVVPGVLESHRPSGSILAWWQVRLLTPFINLYAVVFLVGGAIWSGIRFARQKTPEARLRAIGNGFIAFGGILPGIGGSLAKAGLVEALYLGEFTGLLFIWTGFTVAINASRVAVAAAGAKSPA